MSNFSFYYAHHMSTIEGGMVCTDDAEVYQQLRMLRSHGMVREASDAAVRNDWIRDANPDLNPDFIFAFPAYNVRSTEIGAHPGPQPAQAPGRQRRAAHAQPAPLSAGIDGKRYRTDFKLEGSSNYAFNSDPAAGRSGLSLTG